MTSPLRGVLVFGLCLADCAAPRPGALAPREAASPEQHFLDTVQRYDVEGVRAELARHPELAKGRSPRGRSALAVAGLVMATGEYFMPPAQNQVLKAILEHTQPGDLFEACLVGDLPRARAFLDQDPALIRSNDSLGWTPLHYAAYSGNLEWVKLLLGRGAVLDAVSTTHYRNTPLQAAMLTGQAAVARLLVEAGADVNHQQVEGGTVLDDAARQGDLGLVRFFLDHGADPGTVTLHGGTPVEEARTHGHPEIAAELEKRIGSRRRTPGGPWTAAQLWNKCKGCHGVDGRGNTTVGARERVPDFTSSDWQARLSDDAIRDVITHGSPSNPTMKAWGENGERFSRAEIESLVAQIRRFKQQPTQH